MHSSRILCLAAGKGLFVPPRTMLGIFVSAANGLVSLVLDEGTRKVFSTAVDNGIILPEVLGQASLGYVRILALHDELNQQPILENFNAAEFLQGVKPALEEFHKVQASLHNRFNEIAQQEEDEQEDSSSTERAKADSNESISPLLEAFLKADGRFSKVANYDFKKKAEKEPHSDEARLLSMATPELFDVVQWNLKASYLKDPEVKFHENSVEIRNAALLSARGFVMETKELDVDVTRKESGKEGESVEGDDEVESGKDTLTPGVAAQVEVLYDVEQSMTVGKRIEDKNAEEDEQTRTVTRKSVAVGVFEGWLTGDPNGELRWRVTEVRPAWEFPLLSNRTD